ncbi:hypothetical protein [Chryseobacterium gambrini]|uniref:Uncharacterized protein n=1 Tax=Chryseobacterium gambrini TaxID=373672 RepID=A0ABM8K6Q6_9FLAO|nr:hypothetical protein CRDW_20770 [Chryseobacterium gambrini]
MKNLQQKIKEKFPNKKISVEWYNTNLVGKLTITNPKNNKKLESQIVQQDDNPIILLHNSDYSNSYLDSSFYPKLSSLGINNSKKITVGSVVYIRGLHQVGETIIINENDYYYGLDGFQPKCDFITMKVGGSGIIIGEKQSFCDDTATSHSYYLLKINNISTL